jgi:hypothetical protein
MVHHGHAISFAGTVFALTWVVIAVYYYIAAVKWAFSHAFTYLKTVEISDEGDKITVTAPKPTIVASRY